MEQNIIELGFDVSKFSSEQKAVLDGLNQVLASAEKIDGLKIAPGVNPSWKMLKDSIAAQSLELKKLQDANVQYVKSQEALTKAETAQIVQMQQKEKLAQQEIKTKKAQTSAANDANKAKQEEQKLNDALSNDYQQLSLAYRDAALKAKNYALTLGEQHPITLQAIKDATQMGDTLKRLDASVGQHQRNVGNYASGWSSFNNIMRETPNFAISAQTGIQSLSNNIPMFADELAKARKEGKSFGTILMELGKNMFSFGGIATLLTIAFTALPKILSAMSSESTKTAKAVKTFSEVQQEATRSTINERVELEALLVVAKDETKSKNERSAAVKKINDIMPDYLGKITLEGINTAETTAIINEYISMLSKKALAQAYITKIQELYGKQIDIEATKIEDNIKWYSLLWQTIKNGNTPSAALIELTNKGVKNRQENIKSIGEEITALKNKFNEDLKNGKAILDLDKEMAKPKENKDKEKLDERNRKAAYETAKMILEANRDLFKTIAEDEENSMGVRIVSLQEYSKKVKDLIELQRNFEITEKGITEAEKTKINTEAQLANVKSEFDFLKLLRDMQAKHLKDLEKQKKDAEAADKKRHEDSVKEASDKIATEELRNQTYLNEQLTDLAQRFLDGDITSYENYEKEKEKITQQSLLRTNAHIIAALKEKQKLYKEDSIEYKQIQAAITNLDKQSTESFIDEGKKKENAQKEVYKKLQELAFEGLDLIEALTIAQFENEKNRLIELQNLNEERYAKEIENVKNSTMSEVEKAAKIKVIEAEAAADKRKYDREIREQNTRKAKAERQFQIFQIIGNTAIEVTKNLSNPILAAIIAALGAVQLAKVIATPIPKYADGTDNHPGGLAIFGEAGPEIVKEPGKEAYLVNQATLGALPKGTKVTPTDQINQVMMETMIKSQGRFMNRDSYDSSWDVARWQTSRLEKAFAKAGKKPINVKVSLKSNLDVNKSFGR